jgi:hypothetical protein
LGRIATKSRSESLGIRPDERSTARNPPFELAVAKINRRPPSEAAYNQTGNWRRRAQAVKNDMFAVS